MSKVSKELAPRSKRGLRRRDDKGGSPLDLFLREKDGLHRELDRFFEGFLQGRWPASMLDTWAAGDLNPSIDLTEDDKAYHVSAELPGMDQADVDVSFSDGLLTISGEKKQEQEEKDKDFYRRERSYGAFRRSLAIPGTVDEAKIDATFRKGVLKIQLPKTKEAQKKARKIAVKSA
jgi:HSP20 family protein